jgi:plasmid stability protein
MPAQSGAATALDGGHDLQLQEAQVPAVLLPVARSVGAEDLRDLRHEEVLRGSGSLQRRDDLAQDLGGDLGVERCRLELFVSEQHLDHADIDLLFE